MIFKAKIIQYYIFPLLVWLLTVNALSQPAKKTETDLPDPKVAFLRSLVVPGWGHHYVNPFDWSRGKYHLGAEIMLIISYFGLRVHSNNLEYNWHTYARTETGIDIENRNRSFQLAMGDFDNLQAYNEFQERSRNWDRFFKEIPANRWNWQSDQARNRYNNLRERFETIDQQLPALLSLMVVNRLISGISAYNRAKKRVESTLTSAFHLSTYRGTNGIMAHLQIEF